MPPSEAILRTPMDISAVWLAQTANLTSFRVNGRGWRRRLTIILLWRAMKLQDTILNAVRNRMISLPDCVHRDVKPPAVTTPPDMAVPSAQSHANNCSYNYLLASFFAKLTHCVLKGELFPQRRYFNLCNSPINTRL